METPVGDSGTSQAGAEPPCFQARSFSSFLLSGLWWRQQAAIALRFAPFCLSCGLGLSFANIIVVAVYYFFELQMKNVQAHPDQLIEKLMFTAVVLLAGVAAGLFISLWALTKWLFNLTAYAHSLLSAHSLPEKGDFSRSMTYVSGRRGYLTRLWLLASLYLLPPVLPLSVLIALKVVTGPEFVIQGKPVVSLPEWVHVAAILGAALLSTVSAAYTLSTIVFSAVSQASPWATATASLKQCFLHGRAVLAMTLAVVAMNVLVSSPQMLLLFTPVPGIIQTNLFLNIGSQIWLGIMSLWLWPLSLAPFCELVRKSVE